MTRVTDEYNLATYSGVESELGLPCRTDEPPPFCDFFESISIRSVNMAAKAEFYDNYVGAVKALSAERVKKILDTIKKGKVALMNTDCYAIKSDTIYEIIGKNSPQNSSYFAILYMGWPLDSQANPLCVKAVFKAIHGTTSTSGGVIVPCSVIDTHGLQVQVSPMHDADS